MSHLLAGYIFLIFYIPETVNGTTNMESQNLKNAADINVNKSTV